MALKLHEQSYKTVTLQMKGTKVQTLGGRSVAGAWLVAWAIMAMGAIINTRAPLIDGLGLETQTASTSSYL